MMSSEIEFVKSFDSFLPRNDLLIVLTFPVSTLFYLAAAQVALQSVANITQSSFRTYCLEPWLRCSPPGKDWLKLLISVFKNSNSEFLFSKNDPNCLRSPARPVPIPDEKSLIIYIFIFLWEIFRLLSSSRVIPGSPGKIHILNYLGTVTFI